MNLPLFGWVDKDDSRLHAVRIDAIDVSLEIAKLFHCL